jgi:hypothetical protein
MDDLVMNKSVTEQLTMIDLVRLLLQDLVYMLMMLRLTMCIQWLYLCLRIKFNAVLSSYSRIN